MVESTEHQEAPPNQEEQEEEEQAEDQEHVECEEEEEDEEDEFLNNHDLIGVNGIIRAQKNEIDKKKLELRMPLNLQKILNLQ